MSGLTIGALALSPSFDKDVTAYSAITTNATNTITATPSSGCTVAIDVDGVPVNNGDPATWVFGINVVTIVVSNGSQTTTYTVDVDKQ